MRFSFVVILFFFACEAKDPNQTKPGHLDRGVMAKTMGEANTQKCRGLNGPSGRGHITVTFANDGTAIDAALDGGSNLYEDGGAVVGEQVEPLRGIGQRHMPR